MKDLTGQKFNRLTAIKAIKERNNNGEIQWLCQCDCGKETIVASSSLIRGKKKSCGCLFKDYINSKRVHFGCVYCGSDQHYAKGYCKSCYEKARRGTLE